MHAFVTSLVDYCNAIYAEAPKTVTDKLQRLLNAAARVVSDTRKFDRGLTSLLRDELHWLVYQRGLLTRWMSWCTFYLTTYFSYFTKIFHNQVDYITATFCRCSNFGIKTSNNDLRKIATFWLSVKLSWRHSKFCNCSKLTTPIFLAAYNTNWALLI